MEANVLGEQFYRRFKLLSFIEKKEISDFMDLLLNRKQLNFNHKKRILMNTSVWDEENEKAVKEVKKGISSAK